MGLTSDFVLIICLLQTVLCSWHQRWKSCQMTHAKARLDSFLQSCFVLWKEKDWGLLSIGLAGPKYIVMNGQCCP